MEKKRETVWERKPSKKIKETARFFVVCWHFDDGCFSLFFLFFRISFHAVILSTLLRNKHDYTQTICLWTSTEIQQQQLVVLYSSLSSASSPSSPIIIIFVGDSFASVRYYYYLPWSVVQVVDDRPCVFFGFIDVTAEFSREPPRWLYLWARVGWHERAT